jgi:hypothetical protein
MTFFNQENQKVNYQFNSAGNTYFGNVRSTTDFISELEKLKSLVDEAKNDKVLGTEVATEVKYEIEKAANQAQSSNAKRSVILKHLSNAKEYIKEIGEVSTIVAAIVKAIELVKNLF